MAIISNLLVRLGVDDDGVRRGTRRAEAEFERFGDQVERMAPRFTTFGEDAGRGFGEGFGRDANGRLHDSLGRLVGEGTGIGQSLGMNMARGLGGTGPMMIAGIAAAIALLPTAGALAATGLVLAFGGAFAAIGLAAAFTNKGVKKEFTGLVKHVKSTMREISKPFVETWNMVLSTARRVFDKFAPELAKAFKRIAPGVSRFVEQLGKGFEKLAPAIDPLSKAFTKLMDAIGPSLPGIFEGIASGLIQIADLVAANPDLFAGFITGLLQLIPAAIKFVAVLTRIFVAVADFAGTTDPFITALGLMVPSVLLVMAALKRFGGTLTQVGGFFVGLWNTARAVWNGIWSVISTALTMIKSVISSGIAAARSLFSRGWSAIVSAVTRGASRVMSVVSRIPGRIKNALGNLGGLLVGAGRRVIQGLINGITSMIGRLGSAMGRVASTIARFLPGSPVREGPLRVLNRGRAGGQIAAMLAGGMEAGTGMVANAAATMAGAAGIGTAGRVTPRGVRAVGGSPARIVLDVAGGDDDLKKLITKWVRIDGHGDVQAAFGQ